MRISVLLFLLFATGCNGGEVESAPDEQSTCEALCEIVNACAGDTGRVCQQSCEADHATSPCVETMDALQRCTLDSAICIDGRIEHDGCTSEQSAYTACVDAASRL
jgi:hypothetical protein